MKWWIAAFLVTAFACTKPNPQSCADGTCTDPGLPFCDVGGEVEGQANTCIAVSCTPGEFAACRGDREIACNAQGTDYELITCERGCDAGAGGCRLCNPNETACTNGKVASCDSAGAVTSSEVCALGCFEDQPRCRQLAPSNNLGTYLDMVPTPPDLELASAVFTTDDGNVMVSGQSVAVPNFLVPTAGNGAQIRVFVVNSLKLTSATVAVRGDPRDPPGPAFAIVARGNLTILGEILVDHRVGVPVQGCRPAGTGTTFSASNGQVIATGGGGGGNATDGASGGAVAGNAGGVADTSSGTALLVPLRGGCAGGYGESNGPGSYGNGGGAVQLSSGGTLDLDATINVSGGDGLSDHFDQTNGYYVGGGGAGGSILLEGPVVRLGSEAKLLATGGNGAQACAASSTYCGASGVGAHPGTAATTGMTVPYNSASNLVMSGGGGGGGLGRVRINTADGTYEKANTTNEAAAVTSGQISTR